MTPEEIQALAALLRLVESALDSWPDEMGYARLYAVKTMLVRIIATPPNPPAG